MRAIITKGMDVDKFFSAFCSRVKATWNKEEMPEMELVWQPVVHIRSIAQNRLYWQWMDHLAKYFTEHGHPLTKDQAHDLMCHTFLGYYTRKIGQTEVTSLRTTTWPKRLDTGEMSYYMDQIDAWAVDKGCYLPTPADLKEQAMLKRRR